MSRREGGAPPRAPESGFLLARRYLLASAPASEGFYAARDTLAEAEVTLRAVRLPAEEARLLCRVGHRHLMDIQDVAEGTPAGSSLPASRTAARRCATRWRHGRASRSCARRASRRGSPGG